MENKNIQTVKDSIEQITNAKNFDRIYEYFDKECVFHNPPYVGTGIFPDDSSGERVVIQNVAPNGPSAGVVQEGDVLLRATDDSGSWESYDDLRTGLWGQGKVGTKVTLTLLRNGETIEANLVRGRVEGFDFTLAEAYESWRHYLQEEMPDLKSEINQIMASGDLVAYYATNSGTSKIYNQSAVWTECNILRLEDEKIVEWWGAEDTLSQWRQFGFQIKEPNK
jgi:predicted ester cyclase